MTRRAVVAAVVVGCAATEPASTVRTEAAASAEEAATAPAASAETQERGARRGVRTPSLEVLGAGRVTALTPTDDGLALGAEGPGGPLRWRVDGRGATRGEAGAPTPSVVREASGWRVGDTTLAVRCDAVVRGPGAVMAPGGGVALDPCAGALIRWGQGWQVQVAIGDVLPGAWLVGDGAGVGVVRAGPAGLQWQGWSVADLTPVAAVSLPLPGGERVVARGVTERAAPPGHTLEVALPEGLTVVGVAMVDGALIVAGDLDVGGVPSVALARVNGP